MPDKQALNTILNLQVDKHAPVFMIWSAQQSPRLHYACEFIFNHVLKVNFILTDNADEWQQSSHYKISYSETVPQQGLHIVPHTLLFEKNIAALKPVPLIKNNLLYVYETSAENTSLHFDVFSAVFYFISRYEEWQTFTPDTHGRFEAQHSLLYAHKYHLKPVVDLWIYELKAALQTQYPNLIFPAFSYKAISTIDVDNLYAYKAKGFVRTAGAALKDIVKADFKNLTERLCVLSGSKKDPFDIYDEVSTFCNSLQVPLIFFFLFKNGTAYDRTVDPRSPAFKKVFSVLKQKKAWAGIHPSYYAAFETGVLNSEVNQFAAAWGEPVTLSRQHFLRYNIRSTPELLMQQGIIADFTMGFASSPGFRAGTSQPFYYYNFNAEKKEALLCVPFCAMDGAYFVYDTISPDTALTSLLQLAAEVKSVNGLFITVFHERTFSNHLYSGFGTLYKNMYAMLKEL